MEKEIKKRDYCLEGIKTVIIAVICSLAMILILALLMKFLNFPTEWTGIANQIIKGVSIFIACLICLKLPNNNWLRGCIIGILFVCVAYVIFSLLDGKFVFGFSLINDIALGGIVGLVSGIIAGLIRKK